MSLFWKVWKDPVWSKIISALILLAFSTLFVFIKSYIDDVGFIEYLKRLLLSEIQLWIVILLLIAVCVGCWGFVHYKEPKEFRYDNHSYENDIKLFESHLKDLTPNNSIYFLRTNNFAGFSFHLSSLSELEKFFAKYKDDPRIEFFHPQMESLRQKLMSDIDHFEDLLCVNTFPGSRDDLQTVPPEWETENPKHFWEVVDGIHTAAKQVCKDYDEFVKLGKRVIKI